MTVRRLFTTRRGARVTPARMRCLLTSCCRGIEASSEISASRLSELHAASRLDASDRSDAPPSARSETEASVGSRADARRTRRVPDRGPPPPSHHSRFTGAPHCHDKHGGIFSRPLKRGPFQWIRLRANLRRAWRGLHRVPPRGRHCSPVNALATIAQHPTRLVLEVDATGDNEPQEDAFWHSGRHLG
jgi:hypothetical protein